MAAIVMKQASGKDAYPILKKPGRLTIVRWQGGGVVCVGVGWCVVVCGGVVCGGVMGCDVVCGGVL